MCISDDRFGIKELCLSYSLLDVNYDIFGLLAEIGIAAQKYGIRELTRLVDKSIMELLPKNDCTDWIDEPMSECSDEMDHNLECLVQYAFCEGSDNSELQNHLSQPIVAFFLRKPASYSDTVVETWKEFLKKNPQVLLKLFESVVNSESVRDRKSPIPSKPSSTCNNCGGSADPKSHNDLECHLERLNSRTTEGVLTGSAQDDPELTREKKELSGALKKLDAATHREAFRIICKAVPVLREFNGEEIEFDMNEIPPIAPRELSELVHSKDTSSHPSISRVVSDCSSHSFGRGLVSRERDQAVGSRQTIVGSVAKMLDEMREDQVAAQSQSFPPPAMSKSELPHVLDPKTATFAFHPNPSEGAESALENEVQQKNPLTSVKVDVGYNKKPWSEQANPGSPTGVHLECPDYFQGNGPVVVKPAMTVGVDFGTKFSAVTAYEPRSGPTFSPGRLDRIAYHLPRQPSVPIVPICNESVYATAGTTRCNAGEMNWPHAKMATSNDKPFPGNPAPPCHHDKPYADHALATHQRELVKAKKAQEELLRARGGTKCVKIHRCSTIRISRRPITTARVLRPANLQQHKMKAHGQNVQQQQSTPQPHPVLPSSGAHVSETGAKLRSSSTAPLRYWGSQYAPMPWSPANHPRQVQGKEEAMSLNKPKSGLIKLDALSDDDSDCWTQWERDALTMQIIPVRRAVQKLAGGARGRRVHFPTMAPGDTDFHLNDSYFHKPHWDDLSDGFFDTKYAFD